jgi:large subunit ribosomal protein L33
VHFDRDFVEHGPGDAVPPRRDAAADREKAERKLKGGALWGCTLPAGPFALTLQSFQPMQEIVTLECTEARKEGKTPSRYLTTRNKKTVTERIEKKKYNPFLRRHTMHKEIK